MMPLETIILARPNKKFNPDLTMKLCEGRLV